MPSTKYDPKVEQDKYINKLVLLIIQLPLFISVCFIGSLFLTGDSLIAFIAGLAAITTGAQIGSLKEFIK